MHVHVSMHVHMHPSWCKRQSSLSPRALRLHPAPLPFLHAHTCPCIYMSMHIHVYAWALRLHPAPLPFLYHTRRMARLQWYKLDGRCAVVARLRLLILHPLHERAGGARDDSHRTLPGIGFRFRFRLRLRLRLRFRFRVGFSSNTSWCTPKVQSVLLKCKVYS